MDAGFARRRRGGSTAPGWRRRSGSRTSTTESVPSCTSSGDDVRLYSRDLNEVTSGYPEVIEAARRQPWDGILDGELLAWRNGAALPFQLLQTRLGRNRPARRCWPTVPVIYVALRCACALGRRRWRRGTAAAAAAAGATRSRLDASELADQPGLRRVAADHARRRRTSSGRSSTKLGCAERGLDGQGSGQRLFARPPRIWLDQAQAALRHSIAWWWASRLATAGATASSPITRSRFWTTDQARDGRLATIGKAYSGLTDAELAEMTVWFKEHTLQQMAASTWSSRPPCSRWPST